MIELNKIYVGDTLDTLDTFPDECIDITVTSPPYNKMGVKGGLVGEVDYQNSSDRMNENGYQANQIDILNELYRVTKQGGHVFYNHKLRWVNGTMIHPMEWIFGTKWMSYLRQEIIWDRTIAGNIRGWRFWQIDERIYWMQKGITKGEELKSKHAKMTSIWKIFPENKFPEHPAPFPIEIPTRCIYSIADEQNGLTVLDPYCGIGSTLVAAKALKHNYIGIDCSQKYVDAANQRLEKMNEIERVMNEVGKHCVEKSYAERKKSSKK